MQKIKVPRYIQWIVLTGIIFLVLMTILRVVLVLIFGHNVSWSSLISPFFLGFRFDLRMVCIVSLIVFLIGSIKPLHPLNKKAGRAVSFWLYGIYSAVFCFLYAIDFYHYAYLSQRLNGSILNYSEDAKISLYMMWESYPLIKFFFGVVLGVLGLLALIRLTYNYILSKPIASVKSSRIIWGSLFFIFLAIGIFGRVGQYPLRWSDAFSFTSDFKSQVALNPFQSFFSSISYRHATYDIAKVKEHYTWLANELGVTKPDTTNLNFERVITPSDTAASRVKPNVVLVICESFSAYKSSMIGNPLNTTPFFNQMAKEGIYFQHCFSSSYGTARGIWAVITGVPDVQLFKTASRNPSAVDQHTIINDFAGYEKHYFLGGSLSWANIRGLLSNNIDDLHFHEEGDYKAAKIDVWGISDKNLFLEANKVFAVQNKPFFAVVQTSDNHRPYTIPDEDQKVFQKQKVPLDTLKKYGFSSVEEYNAFRYTDFSFKTFIEAAKKEKYFDNTIFVFVGDHGIVGDAGDMLPKIFTNQSLTSEHVPLLIYAPSLVKPATYSFPASQVDVLPTIAGLCNIGYRNTTLGKDLLQVAKTGDDHSAFVIDIDSRKIGVINNNIYYNYRITGSGDNIGSIIDNKPLQVTDSLRSKYRFMTDAYYHTSRYLLLNNKKKTVANSTALIK
jgi:phosphoglycerol transferase MdoB-like AlkP superfamily enzyme